MTMIVASGASGRLGGRVARRLAGAGLTQRLLVRDPARAPDLPGAEVAVAQYADPEAMRAALDGAAVVLMVQDDIADAAAAVLREPLRHAGRTYDLTGPEALGFAEMAATLTAVTGRPVSYHDETGPEAYASRASYGGPDWQLDAWVSTYTSVAAGELAAVSPAVEQLTGHPATSLEQLLRS
jgi:NAD(P)H dehydrogenase (quinone)